MQSSECGLQPVVLSPRFSRRMDRFGRLSWLPAAALVLYAVPIPGAANSFEVILSDSGIVVEKHLCGVHDREPPSGVDRFLELFL